MVVVVHFFSFLFFFSNAMNLIKIGDSSLGDE